MRNADIDKVAKQALNSILARSIRRRKEYGGVIYLDNGKYYATEARTSDLGNTVDVGLREVNKSCPEGTKPVAYYHTHPNIKVGPFNMEYNKFSPEDKTVAQEHHLDAYLGTLDGSFFMYDPNIDKVYPLGGGLKNTGDDDDE